MRMLVGVLRVSRLWEWCRASSWLLMFVTLCDRERDNSYQVLFLEQPLSFPSFRYLLVKSIGDDGGCPVLLLPMNYGETCLSAAYEYSKLRTTYTD